MRNATSLPQVRAALQQLDCNAPADCERLPQLLREVYHLCCQGEGAPHQLPAQVQAWRAARQAVQDLQAAVADQPLPVRPGACRFLHQQLSALLDRLLAQG